MRDVTQPMLILTFVLTSTFPVFSYLTSLGALCESRSHYLHLVLTVYLTSNRLLPSTRALRLEISLSTRNKDYKLYSTRVTRGPETDSRFIYCC